MSQINMEFLLDNLQFSIAEHELVYDAFNNPVDYKYIYVNQYFCDELQVTKEQVLNKTVFTLFPETEQYWIDSFADVVETGEEKRFVHYSSEFDKHFSVQCFKSGNRKFTTVFKDVTYFVSGGETSDFKLMRTLGETSKAAFFTFDIKNNTLSYSRNLEGIIGRKYITMENYLNEFVKLTHPDDLRKVAKINRDMLSGNIEEVSMELRFYNQELKDYIWVYFFAYVSDKKKFMPVQISGIIRDITLEKNTEASLSESEELFKNARHVANMTTFLYHPKTKQFTPSEELNEFLGIENLIEYDQFRNIVIPEDLHSFDYTTDYILNHETGRNKFRINKNGQIRYIQSYLYSKRDTKRNTSKVFGVLRDITIEEENHQTLEYSRRNFSQIFQTSPAGIVILDDEFNVTLQNQKFQELTGKNSISFKEFLGANYDRFKLEMNKETIEDFEIQYFKGLDLKHYSLTVKEMLYENQRRYQVIVVDETEKVEQRERINFFATRDILTKVYNRNFFEQYTQEVEHEQLGLLLCDIDGLKLINDAFSHIEGDKLLIQFAAHLNKSFPNDMVARLGGDEFAIIIKDVTFEELEEHEIKIRKYVNDLFMFGISIDVSIGYAIKEATDDFYESFIVAENLMYRRKLTERSSRKSNALSTIMQTLHEKTHETEEHCDRVSEYAVELLKQFGHKRTVEHEEIRLVSQVHDIGKIAISEGLLSKTDPLTYEEYDKIKSHSEAGFKIVSNIIANDDIAIAVLYHHEYYDGTGYPHNLKGEEIPLYSRIVSICDAYDTMVSGRKYQNPIPPDKAQKELIRCKGTQFDPHLVDLFIEYLKTIK